MLFHVLWPWILNKVSANLCARPGRHLFFVDAIIINIQSIIGVSIARGKKGAALIWPYCNFHTAILTAAHGVIIGRDGIALAKTSGLYSPGTNACPHQVACDTIGAAFRKHLIVFEAAG